MPGTLPLPLRGIIPPLVTPLRDRETLDLDGLHRLIEHVIDGGVHGVFVLGTTGEAPSLAHRLRHELIEHACRIVDGRVPVLVGITDTSFVESLTAAGKAADAGADAVVLAPPYYFPAGQPELVEYVTHLVPELPLPLFLYNMPATTKLIFEAGTVEELMGLEPIVGIKDSSGDAAYLDAIIALAASRPEWTILVGSEDLLARAIAAGAHGGVNGGANVDPRLFVELYRAAVGHKESALNRLRARLDALHRLYEVGHYWSAGIKGIKCALSLLGVSSDFMAEPFHRFQEEERREVAQLLVELGLSQYSSPA